MARPDSDSTWRPVPGTPPPQSPVSAPPDLPPAPFSLFLPHIRSFVCSLALYFSLSLSHLSLTLSIFLSFLLCLGSPPPYFLLKYVRPSVPLVVCSVVARFFLVLGGKSDGRGSRDCYLFIPPSPPPPFLSPFMPAPLLPPHSTPEGLDPTARPASGETEGSAPQPHPPDPPRLIGPLLFVFPRRFFGFVLFLFSERCFSTPRHPPPPALIFFSRAFLSSGGHDLMSRPVPAPLTPAPPPRATPPCPPPTVDPPPARHALSFHYTLAFRFFFFFLPGGGGAGNGHVRSHSRSRSLFFHFSL